MKPASTTPDLSAHRRGLLFVFVAGVLWSTIGLFVRMVEDASAWQILLYRSASLTVLLFFVLLIRTRRNPFAQVRQVGWPGVIGGLALVGAYAGGIYSIQHTTVANAMLLFATAPFMAALLGWAVLREPVRLATGLAVFVAVLGIWVMFRDQSGALVPKASFAALASALCYAIFTVALRWGRSGDMLPAVFLSGIFAIVIMGAVCLLLGLPLVLSPQDTGVAMGMGVFQVGVGLIFYTLGSRSLPAAELTLLSLSEVLLAPLWVWLVLGETVARNTLLGGAILLLAIVFNALTGARAKAREKRRETARA